MGFQRQAFTFLLIGVLLGIPFHKGAGQSGGDTGEGKLSGSIQIDAQTYKEDSIIGAPKVEEVLRSNSFLQLHYQWRQFEAGIRFEAYQKTLLGIDPRYDGAGFPYKYVGYHGDWYRIRVGNFYEQFGSGMILRAYWAPLIGFDNSLNGVQLHLYPHKGVVLKGVLGTQRYYWEQGKGLVRGIDGEVNLNSLSDSLLPSTLQVTIGGSVVSKYQNDDDPRYNLPENVLAYALRAQIERIPFSCYVEYVHKYNDPNYTNGFIYKPGEALFVSASYSGNGFGLTVSGKRLDNMDFRSDRNARLNDLLINFLPPLAYQHAYRLPTLYLYATQPNGEMGIQADGYLMIPEDTWLGGKYGANLRFNYSRIHSIDTTHYLNDTLRLGYESPFWKPGKRVYYEDFNLEFYKKWSKNVYATFTYVYIQYDKDQILGLRGYGVISSHSGIVDMTYKFSSKKALRLELEYMYAEKDFGSWAMVLTELSFRPHWMLTFMDEYNYGNPNPEKRVHYPGILITYLKGGARLSIGYRRSREGILCVGGVCRQVPASNGFSLSFSSTF